jgi:AcrR family transcriptional regulator
MPTGIAISGARERLFAAAVRVVARDGISALSSRSITEESSVAKGVLHRHFADFDTFLADFVAWHIEQLGAISADLSAAAGSGTVTTNIAIALDDALTPLSLSMINLATSRPGIRTRLRDQTPHGIPILAELTSAIRDYLDRERQLGRISPAADPATLALTVVGTAHLLLAGELGASPDEAAVREIVASIMVGAEST